MTRIGKNQRGIWAGGCWARGSGPLACFGPGGQALWLVLGQGVRPSGSFWARGVRPSGSFWARGSGPLARFGPGGQALWLVLGQGVRPSGSFWARGSGPLARFGPVGLSQGVGPRGQVPWPTFPNEPRDLSLRLSLISE